MSSPMKIEEVIPDVQRVSVKQSQTAPNKSRAKSATDDFKYIKKMGLSRVTEQQNEDTLRNGLDEKLRELSPI